MKDLRVEPSVFVPVNIRSGFGASFHFTSKKEEIKISDHGNAVAESTIFWNLGLGKAPYIFDKGIASYTIDSHSFGSEIQYFIANESFKWMNLLFWSKYHEEGTNKGSISDNVSKNIAKYDQTHVKLESRLNLYRSGGKHLLQLLLQQAEGKGYEPIKPQTIGPNKELIPNTIPYNYSKQLNGVFSYHFRPNREKLRWDIKNKLGWHSDQTTYKLYGNKQKIDFLDYEISPTWFIYPQQKNYGFIRFQGYYKYVLAKEFYLNPNEITSSQQFFIEGVTNPQYEYLKSSFFDLGFTFRYYWVGAKQQIYTELNAKKRKLTGTPQYVGKQKDYLGIKLGLII